MKNLLLVFIVAFALSTMAMASDIAFYIGPYNPGWYGDEQFAHVETIIAETGSLFNDIQQFDDTQLDEFGAWVDDNTNDGRGRVARWRKHDYQCRRLVWLHVV